jgi:hypothetical protein
MIRIIARPGGHPSQSYQDMSCWPRFAMGFDTGSLINVLECKVLGHDQ